MRAARAGRRDRGVSDAVIARADAEGLVLDDEQRLVLDRLARLAAVIRNGRSDGDPLGMYLHGPAGRGKTWISDAFFDVVPISQKRRVHFHGFLEELHRAIFVRRTAETPAGDGERATDAVEAAVGDAIGSARLLVFDEFHVHDPGDARLLTLVLRFLFDREIAVVATSNYAPEGLLPSPIWHPIVEPGIALLREHLEIVTLHGSRDYRELSRPGAGFGAGRWIVAPDTALVGESARIEVRGRAFEVVAAHHGELDLTFDQLCVAPTSPIEYLDWSARFPRWTVRDVPSFAEVPPPARQRFLNVVDILVDRGVPVTFISALELADFISSAGDAGPDAMRLQSRLRLLAPVSDGDRRASVGGVNGG